MVDIMQRTATIEISKDQLSRMAELVKKAVERSLRALFTPDIIMAQEVIGADKAKVLNGALSLETALEIIRISKNLERIADLSANIAEETSFMVLGRVVKHRSTE